MTAPRHIALDARWIFPEISGIGLYTQELIGALSRSASPHRFTLLFNDPTVLARTADQTGVTKNPAFHAVLVNNGPFSLLDQIRLPRLLTAWGVDIFHAPNYMMPLCLPPGIRTVVTIHDLIPLMFRDHAPRSKKNRLYPLFRWIMRRVVTRAGVVIAVSESTRRDMIEHLTGIDFPPEKIKVVHEGVRSTHVPAPKKARHELEFLFVGRRDPYKNLPLLISALAEVRRLGLPARLRVVGSDDPRYPEANRLARQLNVNEAITWSGYVSEPALVDAYQQADVFVLPSRYEGFGLPVLESMACGTPVICSRTSSLPEVAGDAALFIDPSRPGDLIDAMCRLIRNPGLREDLARRGLVRAAQFTWDETAKKTLAVYEH
jgi:alpha-1,3-rhamnosyl/mannosyltransferase